MKLLIACDMEGITGVVDWKQVDSNHPEYQTFRQRMTEDVNAAIHGAFSAGINEVVVTDGHGGKLNLVLEKIDSRVSLNCGSPSPLGMIEGIDNKVDGVFFIGYHGRSGANKAVLAHTWNNTSIANVWINDHLVGEIGLNASVCGYFGVPLLMISGDQTACLEAAEFVQGIETAIVKQATAYRAARCLPPTVSSALIEQTAARSITKLIKKQAPQPVKTEIPVQLRIEFFHPGMADNACLVTRTKRLDGRNIEILADNMLDAYLSFRAAATLGV
jgi:D-amino peptidase